MTTRTCPSCFHTWEEEISFPDWYGTLVACKPELNKNGKPKGQFRPVPPYEFCEAWMNEHDGAWKFADEKSAVVEAYWDPKKKSSPWAMFRMYVTKELRLQSERTAAPQSGLLRKSEGRY